MKRILLVGAAFAALTFSAHAADFEQGGAAVASQDPCAVSGVASFHTVVGGASDFYSGTGVGFGGGGKINMCMGSLGVQLDTFGEVVSGFAGDLVDESSGQYGGFAHFYKRDPNRNAFGLLIGVGQIFDSYEGYNPGVLGTVGVDGHWYSGNWTLAGQASYFHSFGASTSSASPHNGFLVTAEGRYFVNPNFKLNVLLGYESDNDLYADYTSHDLFFGGGAEYKFSNSPLSIFVNVTAHNNSWFGDNLKTVTGRVGFAAHFDQPTLQAEDRMGASFGTPFIDTWQNLDNAYYR